MESFSVLELMQMHWPNLLSSFLGGLFGSGVIWAFLSYRQRATEVAVSSAVSIASLQGDLLDRMILLMAKSEEYADVRDRKIKTVIPPNRLNQLRAQIEILKSDIVSSEERLARLEDREPRIMNLKYVRPESPKDLRWVPPV